MKVYVPIKEIVSTTTLEEANEYLSQGGILIETLVERIYDDGKDFRDFIRFVIGLTDACDQ